MEYRMEHDSLGEVRVPADKLWGAQTQRSHENFPIGTEKIPPEVIRAFAILKKGAAFANKNLGKLDEERQALIAKVCDEILAGSLDDQFPLSVWQTGSGTQSNMNVNEVIANRGNQLAGKALLHPNDHCNMSQSSNDTFPTAMHIAAAVAIVDDLLPAVDALCDFWRPDEGERGHRQDGPDAPSGCGAHLFFAGDQRLEKYAGRIAEHDRSEPAVSEKAGLGRHGGGHRPQRAEGVCRGSGAHH